MTAPLQQPERILAHADSLRDAGDWAAAEPLYRAYLALRPDHAAIHVQLGHAVKEGGDPDAALVHYRRAAELAPRDPDPPLQEGQALRLLGRGAEAMGAFLRALALDPASPRLRRQVALSRHRLQPVPDGPPSAPHPAPAGPPTELAFDVTDLLDYIRDSRTPTGIQRVQASLLREILAHPAPPAPVLLVAYDPSTTRWWHVEDAAFRRMLELSRIGAEPGDPAWWRNVAELCDADRRPDAPIAAGATLISLGNAWGIEDYFRGLRLLRSAIPLRYAAFLHDCIPLLMPEHCAEATPPLYARWFASLALQADLLLANSHATAADAARLGAPLGLRPTPAVTALAVDPPPEAEAAAAAAAALDREEPDAPFALFVATIESRKNHLMVFRAWLALLRRLPAAFVPRLVCVGRPGWKADAALDLLARVPELRAKVSILSGVSDLALAGLTSRCLFTVYNSFHEGWGLPVTESLAAGKLAVAPAHSGLLEAGAPGALFFPPGDEPTLVALLERLATDDAWRVATEARIDGAAATRSWREAAELALAHLGRAQPDAKRPATCPAGIRLPLGASATPSTGAAWGEAVRDGLGWWPQEEWGAWTRDGVATLTLPLDLPAGTPVLAEVELRGPPGGASLRLRARGVAVGPWQAVQIAGDERRSVTLPSAVAAAGLALDLDAVDGAALGDRAKRRVGVGVVAVTLRRMDAAA